MYIDKYYLKLWGLLILMSGVLSTLSTPGICANGNYYYNIVVMYIVQIIHICILLICIQVENCCLLPFPVLVFASPWAKIILMSFFSARITLFDKYKTLNEKKIGESENLITFYCKGPLIVYECSLPPPLPVVPALPTILLTRTRVNAIILYLSVIKLYVNTFRYLNV